MLTRKFSMIGVGLVVAMLLPTAAFGANQVADGSVNDVFGFGAPNWNVLLQTGDLSHWGVSPGGTGDWIPEGSNPAGVTIGYAIEDSINYLPDTGPVDPSGTVGPGVGGQNFDAEALYTTYNSVTNRLYVALVTGFELNGVQSGGNFYAAGDIFLDLDGSLLASEPGYVPTLNPYASPDANIWEIAFGLTESTYSNASDLDFDPVDTAIGNGVTVTETLNAYELASDPGDIPDQLDDISYTPQVENGWAGLPFRAIGTNPNVGSVSFRYTQNAYSGTGNGLPGVGTSNVYEFSWVVDPNWITEIENGYSVFWTMSCGNDFLHAGNSTPSAPPLVPVPAAAGLGLLGMALVGLLRRKRR
jgi:MYXO-CTERM domain-containing protein